jgi:hypothetical protein
MQAAEEHAGKATACPKCGIKVQIPSDGAIAAGPAAASTAPPAGAITESKRVRTPAGDDGRDGDDLRRPRSGGSSGAATGAAVGMSVGAVILIVLGVMGCVVIGIVAILAALLIPAVSKVREAAARAQASNNLQQIGIGVHNFHDNYKRLPAPRHQHFEPGMQPRPSDLSWRVSILPFVEHQFLYQQFELGKPWNDGKNQPLLNRRPPLYGDPMSPDVDKTTTIYQYFTGPKTIFPDPDRRLTFARVQDGTSNTILAAQASSGMPWSKPADMNAADLPLPPDRFLALMADGSVRLIDRRKTSDQTLRLAIDPDDGQLLPMDWN